MAHFFEKRDRWGHGMSLWVLAALIFVLPLGIWALKQIHLENDIANWLPEDDPQAKTLSWYLGHFKDEYTMLVAWEGSSLNDPRVARFAERLEGIEDSNGIRRGGVKQVSRVVTPHDVIAKMVKYGVEPEEALRRAQGVLIGTGSLKVRLSDAGRERQKSVRRMLVERAKTRMDVDIELLEPATEWVPPEGLADADTVDRANDDASSTPENETDSDSDGLDYTFASIPEHDFQISWQGMQAGTATVDEFIELATGLRGESTDESTNGVSLVEDCSFTPGSPVALSVAFSEAGIADKSGTLQAVQQIAQEVGIDLESLHMAGRPVANAALNQEVKKAAWNRDFPAIQLHKRSVILLSGIVGAFLAFMMLRSIRLAVLVLFVSYYTAFLAVSLVPATGGSMNMVLVVMPTLLFVLTMSGAIHVANYWKHAAHENMKTAVVEATKVAAAPCALASFTTAIGLMSLKSSTLVPVSDFGVYSAIGCAITLAMVLYGLPSLLQFWPAKVPRKEEVDRTGWKLMGNFLANHNRAVIAASVVVFVASAYGLRWFETETKVIRYFPEESRVVRDYRYLEENLAGIVPVDVIVRFDADSQQTMNFLQRMEVVREVQAKMRAHPEISGTLSLTDFRPVTEDPGKDASTLAKLRYNRTAHETEIRVKKADSGASSFFSIATKQADLKREGDGLLNKAGDELWRITAQVAIMSDLDYGDLTRDLDEIAQTVLKYHPGGGHVVTGMVPVFLRTQQAVLESLIRSFALAFVVIAVVMMFVLKSSGAGLITMVPNLMPVGVVFGLISWCGLSVDIGTMITASVVLGIAVDGTLHLLTWFRKGIENGLERNQAVSEALGHCGPAMWQTSFAVGTGLMMLYPADLLLISRFGWLMATLIGAALVADIIFLPALLAGPLGSLIENTTRSSDSNTPTEQDSTVADSTRNEPPVDSTHAVDAGHSQSSTSQMVVQDQPHDGSTAKPHASAKGKRVNRALPSS